jgi:hypothetical protein
MLRCGTLPFYRSAVGITHQDGSVSKNWPVLEGFTNVNVCSNGTRYKSLSPMLLGPVYFTESQTTGKTLKAERFENFWQYSKLYDIDLKDKTKPLTPENISDRFFQRREIGFKDMKGHRRSVPKARGQCVGANYDGKIYSYIESRQFYVKYYSDLVLQHHDYHHLAKRLSDGENIQILGFDGYDPESGLQYGANAITRDNILKRYLDPSKPFGHEIVLCALLTNNKVW